MDDNLVDALGRTKVKNIDTIFELFYLGASSAEIAAEKITEEIAFYNDLCRVWNKPDQVIDEISPIDPEQDRLRRINEWNIPDEYINLNVHQFLLEKCSNSKETSRVNEEIILFEERGLINLLRLLIALIDHFRKENIIWGVGRGSSCASYCLYLIGVHRIDSIKYDLDIREFLR